MSNGAIAKCAASQRVAASYLQVKGCLSKAVRSAYQLPFAVSDFFKSFHQLSDQDTTAKSKEHDKVRYKPWSKFLDAAYFLHQIDRLRRLLPSNDPNFKDIDGATALHAAALSGNIVAIHLLVAAGADIEAKEMRGQTPIHFAARRGHLAAVNLLATLGADVDSADNRGKTPLRTAAKYGHLSLVSSVIALGANVNAQDAKKQNPYFVACLQGRMQVAQYLRDLKAETNIVNRDGKKADDVMGKAGFCAYMRYLFSAALTNNNKKQKFIV